MTARFVALIVRLMLRSIFHYRSATRYLAGYVEEQKKLHRTFSVRNWSKELGFKSHSQLAMILSGRRKLTLTQAPLLSRGMKLSGAEDLFFQSLIQLENAKTPEERQWCQIWLSELTQPASHPRGPQTRQEVSEYEIISSWLAMAILSLSQTEHSFSTVRECHAHFAKLVSEDEVREKIDALVSAQLLKRDKSLKYRATHASVTSKNDVLIRGGRDYHKNVSQLAAQVIDQQTLAEREFQSMAVAIPQNKLALAKQLIRKFRGQFEQAMQSPHADCVYQLNTHFFRLSEPTRSAYAEHHHKTSPHSKTGENTHASNENS